MHPTLVRLFVASWFAFALAGCEFRPNAAGAADGSPGTGSGDIPDPTDDFDPSCRACHGNETSPAPPRSLAGETDTAARGVGAHRAHLDPNPVWHRVVDCADCHAVPAEIGSPGHMDDGDNRAELQFGALAAADGAAPAFDGERCSNTYCHGATLTGGAATAPVFNRVDGSQAACGSCHGAPPPDPHPPGDDCGACHPTVQPGSPTTFLDPDSHINGTVELAGGAAAACDACHGSDGNAAPPRDLAGNTEPTAQGVGAHRAHLGSSDWRREIVCANCHVVPTAVDAPGHLDGDDRAELAFDGLNPAAAYTAANATCDNLYCHGNGRANNGSVVWNQPLTLACDSCHGTTGGRLGGEHGEHLGEGVDCVDCHQQVVDGARNVIAAPLHVNGARDVSIATGGTYDPANRRCTNLACHEDERW